MSGFDVTSSELRAIAGHFALAADTFAQAPAPPSAPPDAGASSAAVAGVLSRIAAGLGDVQDGLSAAGAGVVRCHDVYESCDADGAGLLDRTMPFGGTRA